MRCSTCPFLPVTLFIPKDLPLSQDNINTTKKKEAKSQVEPIDYRPYVQTRISSPSTTQIQSQIPKPPMKTELPNSIQVYPPLQIPLLKTTNPPSPPLP